MRVKRPATSECPYFDAPESEIQSTSNDHDTDPLDLDSQITSSLIQLTGLRATKLTALDKRDFLNYYSKHH